MTALESLNNSIVGPYNQHKLASQECYDKAQALLKRAKDVRMAEQASRETLYDEAGKFVERGHTEPYNHQNTMGHRNQQLQYLQQMYENKRSSALNSSRDYGRAMSPVGQAEYQNHVLDL